MTSLPFFPGNLGIIVFFAIFLLTSVVHLCFALAVWIDAGLLQQHTGRTTFLVGGALWALATLLGGVFVAGVYWLIHHSNLRPQPLKAED